MAARAGLLACAVVALLSFPAFFNPHDDDARCRGGEGETLVGPLADEPGDGVAAANDAGLRLVVEGALAVVR